MSFQLQNRHLYHYRYKIEIFQEKIFTCCIRGELASIIPGNLIIKLFLFIFNLSGSSAVYSRVTQTSGEHDQAVNSITI